MKGTLASCRSNALWRSVVTRTIASSQTYVSRTCCVSVSVRVSVAVVGGGVRVVCVCGGGCGSVVEVGVVVYSVLM